MQPRQPSRRRVSAREGHHCGADTSTPRVVQRLYPSPPVHSRAGRHAHGEPERVHPTLGKSGQRRVSTEAYASVGPAAVRTTSSLRRVGRATVDAGREGKGHGEGPATPTRTPTHRRGSRSGSPTGEAHGAPGESARHAAETLVLTRVLAGLLLSWHEVVNALAEDRRTPQERTHHEAGPSSATSRGGGETRGAPARRHASRRAPSRSDSPRSSSLSPRSAVVPSGEQRPPRTPTRRHRGGVVDGGLFFTVPPLPLNVGGGSPGGGYSYHGDPVHARDTHPPVIDGWQDGYYRGLDGSILHQQRYGTRGDAGRCRSTAVADRAVEPAARFAAPTAASTARASGPRRSPPRANAIVSHGRGAAPARPWRHSQPRPTAPAGRSAEKARSQSEEGARTSSRGGSSTASESSGETHRAPSQRAEWRSLRPSLEWVRAVSLSGSALQSGGPPLPPTDVLHEMIRAAEVATVGMQKLCDTGRDRCLQSPRAESRLRRAAARTQIYTVDTAGPGHCGEARDSHEARRGEPSPSGTAHHMARPTSARAAAVTATVTATAPTPSTSPHVSPLSASLPATTTTTASASRTHARDRGVAGRGGRHVPYTHAAPTAADTPNVFTAYSLSRTRMALAEVEQEEQVGRMRTLCAYYEGAMVIAEAAAAERAALHAGGVSAGKRTRSPPASRSPLPRPLVVDEGVERCGLRPWHTEEDEVEFTIEEDSDGDGGVVGEEETDSQGKGAGERRAVTAACAAEAARGRGETSSTSLESVGTLEDVAGPDRADHHERSSRLPTRRYGRDAASTAKPGAVSAPITSPTPESNAQLRRCSPDRGASAVYPMHFKGLTSRSADDGGEHVDEVAAVLPFPLPRRASTRSSVSSILSRVRWPPGGSVTSHDPPPSPSEQGSASAHSRTASSLPHEGRSASPPLAASSAAVSERTASTRYGPALSYVQRYERRLQATRQRQQQAEQRRPHPSTQVPLVEAVGKQSRTHPHTLSHTSLSLDSIAAATEVAVAARDAHPRGGANAEQRTGPANTLAGGRTTPPSPSPRARSPRQPSTSTSSTSSSRRRRDSCERARARRLTSPPHLSPALVLAQAAPRTPRGEATVRVQLRPMLTPSREDPDGAMGEERGTQQGDVVRPSGWQPLTPPTRPSAARRERAILLSPHVVESLDEKGGSDRCALVGDDTATRGSPPTIHKTTPSTSPTRRLVVDTPPSLFPASARVETPQQQQQQQQQRVGRLEDDTAVSAQVDTGPWSGEVLGERVRTSREPLVAPAARPLFSPSDGQARGDERGTCATDEGRGGDDRRHDLDEGERARTSESPDLGDVEEVESFHSGGSSAHGSPPRTAVRNGDRAEVEERLVPAEATASSRLPRRHPLAG